MRVPETGRYRLHLKALDLGSAFLGSLKLPSLALPHLEALARDTMEAASMGVLDGAEVVYIARAATRRWMSTNLQVGSRLPAYCTSLGRAILAYLPLEEARRLLQGVSMTAHTEYTVTEPEVLLRMLGEVRRRGYAWNNEELEIGLRSVAAPVRRAGGVVAAINVSAASARISADRMETEFVPRLLEAAEKVSHAIGALELGVAWAHGSPGTGGMDRHATSSSDAVKLVPARTRASTRGAVQGNR
jgi:IclR family pca regulon transcriptional regulator